MGIGFGAMMTSKSPKGSQVCVICGASDFALTVEHRVPMSMGGTHSPENLIYICARCNHRADGLPGFVFERLLANLLNASPEFHNIVLEGRVGTTKIVADILAKRVGLGPVRA